MKKNAQIQLEETDSGDWNWKIISLYGCVEDQIVSGKCRTYEEASMAAKQQYDSLIEVYIAE